MFSPITNPTSTDISPVNHHFLNCLMLLESGCYNPNFVKVEFESYQSKNGSTVNFLYCVRGECIEWIVLAVLDSDDKREIMPIINAAVFREDILFKIERTPWFKLIVQSEKYLPLITELFEQKIEGRLKQNFDIFDNLMFIGGEDKDYTIHHDYEVSSLLKDDIKTVNNEWMAGKPGNEEANSWALHKVSDNILNRPSVGIRHLGKLVAWICIHSSGSIGQLHVIPEYRSLGLARIAQREMTKIFRRLTGNDPILYTHKSNTAAISLFKSEGFVQQSIADQKLFFRH